jgi:hypothetical protein
MRDLADELECSPVTAWRIVKSLGWSANGHRWVIIEKEKGPP